MAKKATPPAPGKAQGEKPPQDSVKVWMRRLTRATKVFDAWEKEFECEHLDAYYRGKHWRGKTEEQAKGRYTINLIFATVETQLPTLLFSRPKVEVEARPDREEEPSSNAGARATLIKHTLQTFVEKRTLHFPFVTTLALRDAYARFGLVEVGYTADWVDNPNADKPVLKDDGSTMVDKAGEPVQHPKKIIKPGSKESLFVKRVCPRDFRCSPGRNVLAENDWVAYCEWHYVEDVKRNPLYKHTENLKASGRGPGDVDTEIPDAALTDPVDGPPEQVQLWKIWDLRRKVRHVVAVGHDKMLMEAKAFPFMPFADLKFFELGDAYYPLPPMFNWLSPQDEINESRDAQRIHRRRFSRRYMKEPIVDDKEFQKLESGEDGVCITVPRVEPSPIAPIPDAELGQSNWAQLAATKDDFLQITGVSGEQRGAPEAQTATQANIVNIRGQIREARARNQVAEWLGAIVHLMLLTIREHMTLPFMVKQSTDPFELPPEEETKAWSQIKREDVEDLDVDVRIDVSSLSPVAADADRQGWNVVLQLLANKDLQPYLMMENPKAPGKPSPLLRKTLMKNGITSENEILEIWRVGQAVMQQQMMMQAMAAVAKSSGAPGGGMPSIPGGTASPAAPAGNLTGTPAPAGGPA
jgi:hypothetical protein